MERWFRRPLTSFLPTPSRLSAPPSVARPVPVRHTWRRARHVPLRPLVLVPPSLVDRLLRLEPLQKVDDRRPNLGQGALEVLRGRLLVDAPLETIAQDCGNRQEVPAKFPYPKRRPQQTESQFAIVRKA